MEGGQQEEDKTGGGDDVGSKNTNWLVVHSDLGVGANVELVAESAPAPARQQQSTTSFGDKLPSFQTAFPRRFPTPGGLAAVAVPTQQLVLVHHKSTPPTPTSKLPTTRRVRKKVKPVKPPPNQQLQLTTTQQSKLKTWSGGGGSGGGQELSLAPLPPTTPITPTTTCNVQASLASLSSVDSDHAYSLADKTSGSRFGVGRMGPPLKRPLMRLTAPPPPSGGSILRTTATQLGVVVVQRQQPFFNRRPPSNQQQQQNQQMLYRQQQKTPNNVRPPLPTSSARISTPNNMALQTPPSATIPPPVNAPPIHHHQCTNKIIQGAREQLLIINHTAVCLKKSLHPCHLPSCSPMRQLLSHMKQCPAARRVPPSSNNMHPGCNIKFCQSTSQLIRHWNGCKSSDCAVCGPVKDAILRSAFGDKRATPSTSTTTTPHPPPPSSSMELTLYSGPRKDNQDWRTTYPTSSRVHVIKQIIKSIYTTANQLRRPHQLSFQLIVTVTRKTELEVWGRAGSREEYLELLAGKTNRTIERLLKSRGERGRGPPLLQEGGQDTAPAPATTLIAHNNLTPLLLPTLTTLFTHPDSLAFRHPVNPIELCIPDYPLIIKYPMDLSTIQEKLERGDYNSDPWLYIEDVYLMFDNAWKYNRKTSRIYKDCTKLATVFDATIDPIMRSLGYCCGKRYIFKLADAFDTKDKDAIPSDPEPEPLVHCTECKRRYHQICMMYLESIWKTGFTCLTCLSKSNLPQPVNNYRAVNLPTTQLSSSIEQRVNTYLKSTTSSVLVRVVSSSNKIAQAGTGVKSRFPNFKSEFPYRSKVIYAFQSIDGFDVLLFAMYVQEYDSSCPEPNSRRVYIAYLDSVQYFEPKEWRTTVYHQIILGYLQYVKKLGYTMAHIWACPPSEGSEYIFRCHPDGQKTPNSSRLQNWYKSLLDKGKEEGILLRYKSSFQDIIQTASSDPTQLPYFEGDLWPKILEDSIKELQTAEEKEFSPKPAKKSKKSKKSSSAASSSPKPPSLSQKITSNLKKLRDEEVFFIIRLTSERGSVLDPIVDPDPLHPIEFIDVRDTFLQTSLEKRWENSTLRRAKWSTMELLYEIHNAESSFDGYTCNGCGSGIREKGYHCKVCDDYDLCRGCFEKDGHEHQMEGIMMANSSVDHQLKVGQTEVKLENGENDVITPKRNEDYSSSDLLHASLCKEQNCQIESCNEIKMMLRHTTDCTTTKSSGTCQLCFDLMRLIQSHKTECVQGSNNCPIWLCPNKRGEEEQSARGQSQSNQVAATTTNRRPNLFTGLDSHPALQNLAFLQGQQLQQQLGKLGCVNNHVSYGSLIRTLPPRQHALHPLMQGGQGAINNQQQQSINQHPPPQQLKDVLRNAGTTAHSGLERRQRVLEIMSKNPSLMVEFIRRGRRRGQNGGGGSSMALAVSNRQSLG